MCKLQERIRKKHPELCGNGFVIHYNNALSHIAYSLHDFLVKNCSTVLEHTPYTPDLIPSDFFLFPKFK